MQGYLDKVCKIPLEYRNNDYFNCNSLFLFNINGRMFLSKVHLYNGYYYTNESCNFKAITVLSIEIGEFNK